MSDVDLVFDEQNLLPAVAQDADTGERSESVV